MIKGRFNLVSKDLATAADHIAPPGNELIGIKKLGVFATETSFQPV